MFKNTVNNHEKYRKHIYIKKQYKIHHFIYEVKKLFLFRNSKKATKSNIRNTKT